MQAARLPKRHSPRGGQLVREACDDVAAKWAVACAAVDRHVGKKLGDHVFRRVKVSHTLEPACTPSELKSPHKLPVLPFLFFTLPTVDFGRHSSSSLCSASRCLQVVMRLKWRSFLHNPPPASDSGSDGSVPAVSKGLGRANTSYWSGVYDKAVRTDSYNDVFMKAQMLAGKLRGDPDNGSEASSSSTLASFRTIADRLLEPDQETVHAVLQDSKSNKRPEIVELLRDYFDGTQKASRLCGTLLQSIDEARNHCKGMEATLASLPRSGEVGDGRHEHVVEILRELAECSDVFGLLESEQMQDVRESYELLQIKVEVGRRTTGKRFRVARCRRLACATGIAIVVGVTIIGALAATHAVASVALAAPAVALSPATATAPVAAAASPSKRRKHRIRCRSLRLSLLKKQMAQLEAFARGTFTVTIMLDTIACLVARLHGDLQRTKRLIGRGWSHRSELMSVLALAKQLSKIHSHVAEQLSDLEEQVYMFCLIINKARRIVFHEFYRPPQTE